MTEMDTTEENNGESTPALYPSGMHRELPVLTRDTATRLRQMYANLFNQPLRKPENNIFPTHNPYSVAWRELEQGNHYLLPTIEEIIRRNLRETDLFRLEDTREGGEPLDLEAAYSLGARAAVRMTYAVLQDLLEDRKEREEVTGQVVADLQGKLGVTDILAELRDYIAPGAVPYAGPLLRALSRATNLQTAELEAARRDGEEQRETIRALQVELGLTKRILYSSGKGDDYTPVAEVPGEAMAAIRLGEAVENFKNAVTTALDLPKDGQAL